MSIIVSLIYSKILRFFSAYYTHIILQNTKISHDGMDLYGMVSAYYSIK